MGEQGIRNLLLCSKRSYNEVAPLKQEVSEEARIITTFLDHRPPWSLCHKKSHLCRIGSKLKTVESDSMILEKARKMVEIVISERYPPVTQYQTNIKPGILIGRNQRTVFQCVKTQKRSIFRRRRDEKNTIYQEEAEEDW